jgi:hypothetical protein
MDLIVLADSVTMATFKRFTNKKILVPTILGVGIVLSAIFAVSPLAYTIAQQQQQQQIITNETEMKKNSDRIPQINGSVNVREVIRDFLKVNANISFTESAETAQRQITNGTVLGGHLGVTQGYLTYTYLVASPSDETLQKVIVDAGNSQVLYTSEGFPLDSFGPSMFKGFDGWEGHRGYFEGFAGHGPLGFWSAPWKAFGFGGGIW